MLPQDLTPSVVWMFPSRFPSRLKTAAQAPSSIRTRDVSSVHLLKRQKSAPQSAFRQLDLGQRPRDEGTIN